MRVPLGNAPRFSERVALQRMVTISSALVG
jgi:hypothetical protein